MHKINICILFPQTKLEAACSSIKGKYYKGKRIDILEHNLFEVYLTLLNAYLIKLIFFFF